MEPAAGLMAAHRPRQAGSVTAGLVIAGGIVMASAADTGSNTVIATTAVALLMLITRLTPIVMLAAGGVLGALGLL